MSDRRDDIEPDTEAEKSGGPDPRLRPPDPAGTQPKWDPQDLLPKAKPPAAEGRLWAPPAAGEEAAVAATAAVEGTPGGTAGPGEAGAAADDDEDGGRRFSEYSARFQFLLGALLAVGASAIVLLVAALVGSGDDADRVALRAGPQWSQWKPDLTSGPEAVAQIAEHVGKSYRLEGKQLVAVDGGPMAVGGVPVTVAIQQPAARGGDIDFVEGTGVLFRMCKFGANDCALSGKPSMSRHLLLRREALELALYAFRYVGVTQAVVLLPPSKDMAKSASGKLVAKDVEPTALLFRRDTPEVRDAVAHPLKQTLDPETPSVGTVARSRDIGAVRSLTNPNMFTFRFQEANQDLRWFLVLDPISMR